MVQSYFKISTKISKLLVSVANHELKNIKSKETENGKIYNIVKIWLKYQQRNVEYQLF